MTTDFANLIRNAKPNVPAGVRGRVLDHVRAHGAVASTPAPFRILLRAAALVMLALLAGVATALVATPAAPQPQVSELRAEQLPDIAPLTERVAALETGLPVAELNVIADGIQTLEAERENALGEYVNRVLDAREVQRSTEWRERHVEHVREHFAREREATVERLRDELGLTPGQEQQVRALLEETGKEAEALISGFYGRGHHRDSGMGDKFAVLANNTEKKLEALLDRQQREKIERESGIVSSSPEDWAPNSEFRDGTDVDVWTNWLTITRE